MKNELARLVAAAMLGLTLMGGATVAVAQSTKFAYQGKLLDAGAPANGDYDFQFKLFDTATVGTGTQQGTVVAVSNLTVTNGVFTVALEFGSATFPGADRFLEIAVKPVASGSFTTLEPRQPINSTPYAIRSLGALAADGLSVACVNCVTSSQITSVNGSAIVGTVPLASLPSGSGSYIQNTTSQQPTSSFNISNNGTAGGTLSANTVNSATQYNIGGNRVLSIGGFNNIFAGVGAGSGNTGNFNTFFGAQAGLANTTGPSNSFVGAQAGLGNTTGLSNSFFGALAGSSNITGGSNAFFGQAAGTANTTGGSNAFFGTQAGLANTTGGNDAFFGQSAGSSNTTGDGNAFFGIQAGGNNTTGGSNAFFGQAAGLANIKGSNNTIIGALAQVASEDLSFATAIGSGAVVSTSHTIQLGTGVDTVNVSSLFVAGSANISNDLIVAGIDAGSGQISNDLVVLGDLRVAGTIFNPVTVFMLNAVKEQQEQINRQQTQRIDQQSRIEKLNLEIEGLKKLICLDHPVADVCKQAVPR